MVTKAYGSITIVDIGDLGTLSVTPESNKPTSVIYDPNVTNKYNPDWGTDNLILTPTIYYGGTQLFYTTEGITLKWFRKTSSDSTETELPTTDGRLIVSENTLNPTTASMVTYICRVSYTEPQSKIILNAAGQITYSLIVQPTTLKSCSITGEGVFAYSSNGTVKGSGKITLTANCTNCKPSAWQYLDASGGWQPLGGSTGTLEVLASNNSIYINSIATIKLVVKDLAGNVLDSPYDIHTITKISDGAAGSEPLVAVLSNEDIWIPCDSAGNPTDGAFVGAETEITVFDNNGTDVTKNSTIEVVEESGCTVDSSAAPVYKVTNLTVETGYVRFKITYPKTDGTSVYKTFNLTKLRAGANGEIISLRLNTVAVKRSGQSGSYSFDPTTIVAEAVKRSGVSTELTSYSGWFKFANQSGANIYTSAAAETSHTITPTESYSSILVELYDRNPSEAEAVLLDRQTVAVVFDGVDSLNFILGNPVDAIPCTSGRLVAADYPVSISFEAYKGITRVPCNATVTLNEAYFKDLVITPGTSSASGTIAFTVKKDANLGGTTEEYDRGSIEITLTAENGATSTQIYTYTKSIQAESGVSAVFFQAYAPNGNVINNGEGSVELATILTEGTTEKDGTNYKWYKWSNGGYAEIPGETRKSYTVEASEVSSYASYKVETQYKGITYSAYISVLDKTDPLQVDVFSTLGDKILNSVGEGCIYAIVRRNGVEEDALKNLKVSAEAPTKPAGGDIWARYYWNSETGKGEVQLKSYNSATSNWEDYSFTPAYNYNWTFAGYSGDPETYQGKETINAKFLYVSGQLIEKKLQFYVEVSKKGQSTT